MGFGGLGAQEGIEDHCTAPAGPCIGCLSGIFNRHVAGSVSLGGAEIEDIITVLEVRNNGPGCMHDTVHEVGSVAAVQSASGDPVVLEPEGLNKSGHGKADFTGLSGCGLEVTGPRVLVVSLAKFFDDGVHGLFPADALPLRIDANSLLGVASFDGIIQAIRVVQKHRPSRPLGADFSPTGGSLGVSLDPNHNPVYPVSADSALAVTLSAGGRYPYILFYAALSRL